MDNTSKACCGCKGQGKNPLIAKTWSPYTAGIVIGLLQIPALVLANTMLGASSSFVTMGGSLASAVDPSVAANPYIKGYLDSVKDNWQVMLVLGVALGAWLSSRLSGSQRPAISPVWSQSWGVTSPWVRYIMAFVGGFILLLGARLANGCASGHGLSGIAQLAVSSFIAIGAMFATGILGAKLFTK